MPALLLQIQGYQPDRCDYPVIEEQTIADGWLLIDVYREIPPNVRCRGGEIPYEATMDIPINVSAYGESVVEGVPYTHIAVEINDYLALLELAGEESRVTPTVREEMPVTEVEVISPEDASNPLTLQVSGFVPDGCVLPIRARVVDEETLTVSVYRSQPPETMNCPLVFRAWSYSVSVPLPEELPDGVYDYDVNGVMGSVTVQNGE